MLIIDVDVMLSRRPPGWGGVPWDGVSQGSATLHPGLSPCAALWRPERY